MKILVINAGSATIKYQLYDMNDEKVLCKGLLDRIGIPGTSLTHSITGMGKLQIDLSTVNHSQGMKIILETLIHPINGAIRDLYEINAVGHRVVHGGENFTEPVIIDSRVIETIEGCILLAPLHNPPNLLGIRACEQLMPDIPQVAVFDTSFHQTMRPEHYLYALPYELYEQYKIRRYGFHGTSHRYVSEQAAQFLGKNYSACKIISMHLGNGASIAAIRNGQVIDTSMGFTPLEGLVMGTRCGDIDPAIVYYLMDKLHLDTKAIDTYLNQKSGMFGITGISHDMRDILSAAAKGHQRAQLALDIYCLRIKGYIGNYLAKLNGCDCLVFTAGVGENGQLIRKYICSDLDCLGIELDPAKNAASDQTVDISTDQSRIKILVIPTNEELSIARQTYHLLMA